VNEFIRNVLILSNLLLFIYSSTSFTVTAKEINTLISCINNSQLDRKQKSCAQLDSILIQRTSHIYPKDFLPPAHTATDANLINLRIKWIVCVDVPKFVSLWKIKKEFTPVTDTKSYITDMFLVVKLDVGCL